MSYTTHKNTKDVGPSALVVDGIRRHGRFTDRPHDVNPSDEAGALVRPLHRLRLKEWIGFAVWHPDLWCSFIVQNAKVIGSSDFIAYAPAAGSTRHRTVFAARRARLPRVLFGHTAGIDNPGYHVTYDFAPRDDIDNRDPHHVMIEIAAADGMPTVEANLLLDDSATPPPLSVSAPLPGGLAPGITPGCAMYTYKHIYSVSGTVRIGDRRYDLDPGRDIAIIDEHRSSLPYVTRWTWGTFATHGGDGLVGANFAHRPTIPGSEEESCIWAPDSIEALTDVDFVHDPDDVMAPWSIRSRDGRLAVTFTPENRETVDEQLGIFSVDYYMMQGRYSGTITSSEREYSIDAVKGVCEHMRARL